jgi:hypothetical protein
VIRALLSLASLTLAVGCYQSEEPARATPAVLHWCRARYDERAASQPTHFPITIRLAADMEPDLADATVAAADFWNDGMGADVFVVASGNPAAQYTVDVSSATDLPQPLVGATNWGADRAAIQLLIGQWPMLASQVAAHELGHALNLLHEDDQNSLMWFQEHEGEELSDLSHCLVATALSLGESQSHVDQSNNVGTQHVWQ